MPAPEIVGFVASVHQDEPGGHALLLPPGIDEPGVLMVVVEVANYAAWHGATMHGMESQGWHWLGASGYCCTSPQAGLSISSRRTTEYDSFVGDGTDTVGWPVDVSSWQRKWIAVWAIRNADGPISRSGQGMAEPGGDVLTPPWSASAPALSLSGIVFPWFGSLGSLPVNYAQDGAVFVDTIDNPSGPDYGGFYSYVAHWSHTMSPPEGKPDWYVNGIGPGELGYYTPGFHIIVPEAGRGVCYSEPESDVGKNLPNLPYWESRCWEQRGGFTNQPMSLSGVGTMRLTGTNDYLFGGDDPGSDRNDAGVYQCLWPFAPEGPYSKPHAARIKFRWHPVGTVLGDISKRSLSYRVDNTGWFGGGAHITFPTTADPYLRLTTGPWSAPTQQEISALPTDTDHILEVDFLHGDVRVKLALADDIDTGPFLAFLTVPYHDPYDTANGDFQPVTYPLMAVDASCSTNDVIDIEDISCLFGPSAGMRFEILVGFGDDSKITFTGWPTQAGTAKWFVSGSEVEPESVDEYAGTATFTRPPPPDAAIQQQGVYAGG